MNDKEKQEKLLRMMEDEQNRHIRKKTNKADSSKTGSRKTIKANSSKSRFLVHLSWSLGIFLLIAIGMYFLWPDDSETNATNETLRVFVYNEEELSDPDPTLDPEEVMKRIFANEFPLLRDGEVLPPVSEKRNGTTTLIYELKEKIPEYFQQRLTEYLKEIGNLSRTTGEGITLNDLKGKLSQVKASYDLVSPIWPKGFCDESKRLFERAHKGYDLAIKRWEQSNDNHDPPTEPNINSYRTFIEFGGSALTIRTWPDDDRVYPGRKYLPRSNINILFTISSVCVKEAQEEVLSALN